MSKLWANNLQKNISWNGSELWLRNTELRAHWNIYLGCIWCCCNLSCLFSTKYLELKLIALKIWRQHGESVGDSGGQYLGIKIFVAFPQIWIHHFVIGSGISSRSYWRQFVLIKVFIKVITVVLVWGLRRFQIQDDSSQKASSLLNYNVLAHMNNLYYENIW